MTKLLRLVLAVAALALGACDSGAQQASSLVQSSDPHLAELAAALLPDLARRAGMELKAPVRLEMRSRDQLVRYLRAKLDEELPEEEARATVAAYALLGLVPDSLDLRAVLLALYTEQVAGFYEPDSTALFVLDDQPEGAVQGLLVHELVHAVQDQTVDLHALTDDHLGNDRKNAAQAAIEGHATLVMLEYLTEQMQGSKVDLSKIPDFAASLRPALEGIRTQFPALASAPPVIQESLLFPYVEGAGYVQALWHEGKSGRTLRRLPAAFDGAGADARPRRRSRPAGRRGGGSGGRPPRRPRASGDRRAARHEDRRGERALRRRVGWATTTPWFGSRTAARVWHGHRCGTTPRLATRSWPR